MTNPSDCADQLAQTPPPMSARFRWLVRLWVANFVAWAAITLASLVWDSWYLVAAFLMLGFTVLALGRYILKETLAGTFAALAEDSE